MKKKLLVMAAVVGMVVMGGCGMEDSASGFTGLWSYNTGSTLVATCDGGTQNYEYLGNATIFKGTSADVVWSDSPCNWSFDVSGETATVQPGQECTNSHGVKFNWAVLTMTLSGDNMVISGNGTMRDSYASCSTSMNISLTKIAD